jgi:hypothetical protein
LRFFSYVDEPGDFCLCRHQSVVPEVARDREFIGQIPPLQEIVFVNELLPAFFNDIQDVSRRAAANMTKPPFQRPLPLVFSERRRFLVNTWHCPVEGAFATLKVENFIETGIARDDQFPVMFCAQGHQKQQMRNFIAIGNIPRGKLEPVFISNNQHAER